MENPWTVTYLVAAIVTTCLSFYRKDHFFWTGFGFMTIIIVGMKIGDLIGIPPESWITQYWWPMTCLIMAVSWVRQAICTGVGGLWTGLILMAIVLFGIYTNGWTLLLIAMFLKAIQTTLTLLCILAFVLLMGWLFSSEKPKPT